MKSVLDYLEDHLSSIPTDKYCTNRADLGHLVQQLRDGKVPKSPRELELETALTDLVTYLHGNILMPPELLAHPPFQRVKEVLRS